MSILKLIDYLLYKYWFFLAQTQKYLGKYLE